MMSRSSLSDEKDASEHLDEVDGHWCGQIDKRLRDIDWKSMRQFWEQKFELCEGYRILHSEEAKKDRRAFSWPRTIAFAQAKLGASGHQIRSGSEACPFVVWVLNAKSGVEVTIAREGYFKDANMLDRMPTRILLWSNFAADKMYETTCGNDNAIIVKTVNYRSLSTLSECDRPDIAVIFMPDMSGASGMGQIKVPHAISVVVAKVPLVVTTRFRFLDETLNALKRNLPSGSLLYPQQQTRCLFSAAGGDPHVDYDDNGWIFAIKGPHALQAVLDIEVRACYEGHPNPNCKDNLVFWGIVDLKFNPELPIWKRVKVLEIGSGRTSKFSGHGAVIKDRLQKHYDLRKGRGSRKYELISSDKKMTHDNFVHAGYAHILPRQVCLSCKYERSLADKIAAELAVCETDRIILKLLNRSRGAGVIPVPLGELDEVLYDVLTPPSEIEQWFGDKMQQLDKRAADLGFAGTGTFDEQCRHWWANECPVFIAEQHCESIPVLRDGLPYDATMRVAFALCEKVAELNPSTASEESACSAGGLRAQWLGGYWKLPIESMGFEHLRNSIVSVAKSGTAPVSVSHLAEVYAALGDSVAALFEGSEPTLESLQSYYDESVLAVYFCAKLAMSKVFEDAEVACAFLTRSRKLCKRQPEGPDKCRLESLINRVHGVLLARCNQWEKAVPILNASLESLATNSNTLYMLGFAHCELGALQTALGFLNKSLLLDSDFKGTYIALGVAYIRCGRHQEAMEISEAGLQRFPGTQQCEYHLAVACCQLALEAQRLAQEKDWQELQAKSLQYFSSLREAGISGQSASNQIEPPWTPSDDLMIQAMNDLGSSGAPGLCALPATIGWHYAYMRV